MIRSAAKNHERVAVVVDPADYAAVLAEIDAGGEISDGHALSARAQGVRAHGRLRRRHRVAPGPVHGARRAARRFPRDAARRRHAGARAALRREPAPEGGVLRARRRARRPVAGARARCCRARSCPTTTCSISTRRCGICAEFAAPAATIVKHNNPCGAAISDKGVADAYRRARETDPVSAFGGIVAVNRPVDGELARELTETFLECVIAPAFAADALPVLAASKNLRLLVCDIAPEGAGRARAAQRRRRLPGADARSRHRGGGRGEGRVEAPADAPTSCAISISPGASASTSSRTRSCSPPAAARWASAPARCRASIRSASRCRRRARRWPGRSSRRTRSSRSATASTRRPRPAPPPSSSPAARCATPRSIAAADEHGMAMVFTGERHFRH